ncbi:MarR family winged helix-turn-helix transcriptional regulator [Actinokineospora enzanensis]|uniref:MarR family winged helix-turn-helix transcriptional regulator n=1 Tax=Actinokineospora enzanensis TaxID=155975 RepID=UPI000369806D|nr:MarR family winged helix-turn-helix transcriptional regulator [Actinokineospora enzanensis]
MDDEASSIADVERSMVAIRRLQNRRALAGLSGAPDPWLTAVVDVVEENETCTVGAVATALSVDQPRASRLVARAVEAGLVCRMADQADARRTLLELTAEGRAHAETVHAFRRATFGRAMADWPADRQAQFAALLADFVASYTALVKQ